eukprot:m.456338 g.456338  ORF g.456338 m.456338 type:complete len:53 (-) comp21041_c0_seq1:58-216(-)
MARTLREIPAWVAFFVAIAADDWQKIFAPQADPAPSHTSTDIDISANKLVAR